MGDGRRGMGTYPGAQARSQMGDGGCGMSTQAQTPSRMTDAGYRMADIRECIPLSANRPQAKAGYPWFGAQARISALVRIYLLATQKKKKKVCSARVTSLLLLLLYSEKKYTSAPNIVINWHAMLTQSSHLLEEPAVVMQVCCRGAPPLVR